MKLIILQEKLKEGVNNVGKIPAKVSTLPILNNILITAEKNFLNLSATDLEIGINWWTLAKIEQEGKIAIPSYLLSNFVGFLPNKKVKLQAVDKILSIECENLKTKIKGFSSEDFPLIPKITTNDKITINSFSFCQALSQIVDIAIPSTARPEMSGLYFLYQKNLLTMAATDSFRLAEKKISFEKPPDLTQEYSFILPQKAAREVINIFGDKEGNLEIYFSPNQVMFEFLMKETGHPQIQLVSRLIEGEYPSYQEIIPKKFITQIILQRSDFLNQIKLASLFSGKINEIKLKINPQKEEVEMFSQNPEFGEHRSIIPGKIKGKPVEVSFNHRFLIDGLLNIKSSEVILELNTEEGPGVLKPVGDASYIYVVMPIKAS